MCYGHECIPTVPSCYYYYCHGNNHYQGFYTSNNPYHSSSQIAQMDVEVTCVIMVSEDVEGTDVSQEGPPTLLYHEVDSKINNLNPNGVYQFSVVAQVTIMVSK